MVTAEARALTEQEYINVTNRARITNAKEILYGVMRFGCVEKADLDKVMDQLHRWEEQLFAEIERSREKEVK